MKKVMQLCKISTSGKKNASIGKRRKKIDESRLSRKWHAFVGKALEQTSSCGFDLGALHYWQWRAFKSYGSISVHDPNIQLRLILCQGFQTMQGL